MHCKWQSKLHVYNKNYPNPQPKILVVAVAHLVWWLLNHMPATYWEVLVRAGFESSWGGISVAVPVAYLAMLNL